MTPAPTTLFLVRHGQTTWNVERRLQGHLNSPLTETGRKQARAAGDILAGTPIAAAFSSPSGRAVETANGIIGDRDISLTHHEGLREIGLGPMEGMPLAEAEKIHPKACRDFWEAPQDFDLPGAERYSQVQTRVLAAIDELFRAHQGQAILLVSHAIAIKTALAHFLDKAIWELGDIRLPENGRILTLQATDGHLALKDPEACLFQAEASH
ncbi:histidine phosphatase family protein [Desulfoluna butyratoxydans]|uniref:Histidine phosphatase superfamily n=1 Tax=Desulfoluna butyratoxydans TaxID=231438 RepID=A0A4U8YIX6_9BACT|nr:histidine phosphatase family protein [Desulfoluna butyratoxydans]VFQ42939.1 histidine phosphatase superfamily [Desulfoluna butyratoxydans]